MYPKSAYRIVEFLLRSSPEGFNVNQLARTLGMSVGGAHRTLKALLGRGLLSQRSMGNALYYRLNLGNDEARTLCGLILIESRNRALAANPLAKVYARDLAAASSAARAAVLFGSIAAGKGNARDVDVLFLVEKGGVRPIERACLELSQTRARPVNPLFMTAGDFRGNIARRDAVTAGILEKGIVIQGEAAIIEALRRLE